MSKENPEHQFLLEDIRNGHYSRNNPTEAGGYLIPIGSPYYGMSKEQLDKVFNKQEEAPLELPEDHPCIGTKDKD